MPATSLLLCMGLFSIFLLMSELSPFFAPKRTSPSTTLWVHALGPHRPPRIGGELPAPGDDHHCRGGNEQYPGTDEPAEIAERKEERALTATARTHWHATKRGLMQATRKNRTTCASEITL